MSQIHAELYATRIAAPEDKAHAALSGPAALSPLTTKTDIAELKSARML